MLAMEHSVWPQVLNPDLSGIVEDAPSFDSNFAGSWVKNKKNKKLNIFT